MQINAESIELSGFEFAIIYHVVCCITTTILLSRPREKPAKKRHTQNVFA